MLYIGVFLVTSSTAIYQRWVNTDIELSKYKKYKHLISSEFKIGTSDFLVLFPDRTLSISFTGSDYTWRHSGRSREVARECLATFWVWMYRICNYYCKFWYISSGGFWSLYYFTTKYSVRSWSLKIPLLMFNRGKKVTWVLAMITVVKSFLIISMQLRLIFFQYPFFVCLRFDSWK